MLFSDCSCRPTSASQVYIYIHVSMRFITVSMHLQVTDATVPCQLVLFLLIYTKSLLPQSCVYKVDYCLYALANHCWHSSVSIKRLSAHLHLQVTTKQLSPTVRRSNKFAWCDSSWWQIRGTSPGWRLLWDIDKFAKLLKSTPQIPQISPNVYLFRQTFSVFT